MVKRKFSYYGNKRNCSLIENQNLNQSHCLEESVHLNCRLSEFVKVAALGRRLTIFTNLKFQCTTIPCSNLDQIFDVRVLDVKVLRLI